MTDKGIDNLRFGIIEQAAIDYVDLLAGFKSPTILTAAGSECYTAIKVYFYRCRDHSRQRALCSGYNVDVCSSADLTEPLQYRLYLLFVRCHQVG